MIPDVKKILILRALVLGDLVFALPALDALHRTYPEAEIVYLGMPWIEDFIVGRVPGVSKVYTLNSTIEPYEDTGFLIHPDRFESFFQNMKAEQFDLGFQMQGGGLSSNPFLRRCQPRVSIGSKEPAAVALDRWLPFYYHQNEIVRLLELVGLAGAYTDDLRPKLPVLDSDREAAQPFLEQIGRPYIILHAGARDPRRRWQPEKFARVGDYVKRHLGYEVVLTGTGLDEGSAREVEEAMHERPLNLSGKLSLPAFVGLISQTETLVGNDTGPFHVALAVGRPAVSVIWSEYIIKSLPPDREDYRAVISWQKHCPNCGKFIGKQEINHPGKDCNHAFSFLESVQSDSVILAMEDLLQQHCL